MVCPTKPKYKQQKPRAIRGFFIGSAVYAPERIRAGRLLGQGLDSGSQTALVASSLVLVNDLLVSNGVNGGHGSLENLGSSSLVASFDRLAHGLDCGAQRGTLAGIMSIQLDCLTSTLTRLCGICHENILNDVRVMRSQYPSVQVPRAKFCKAVEYKLFSLDWQFILSLAEFIPFDNPGPWSLISSYLFDFIYFILICLSQEERIFIHCAWMLARYNCPHELV